MLRTWPIALTVGALVGCAQGRAPLDPRIDAGPPDAPAPFDFPDAVGVDAPGLDAPPMPDLDAHVPVAPDAHVVPVDARVPDAAGECVEGARVPCATSCRTTGTSVCSGGRLGACSPPAERCNAADDDCNGALDDGFECPLGASGACTTSCGSAGSRVCGESCTWGGCAPTSAETCNGRDENCDGQVDEGFRARFAFSTYTELSGYFAACDGSGERFGASCNAAVNRYCRAAGCTNGGFGPVENSDDIANVVCVIGEERTIPFATLSTYHAPCNGSGERIGPNCNAAIHRYCASSGFVSGFGPVEGSLDSAVVSCVRSAEVRVTSYTELAGFLGACDGSTQRYGPSCSAAISRYCGANGFVSGFGPIENDGDTAYVACVRG